MASSERIASAAPAQPVLPEMRSLPGGTFLMGDDAGRGDEQPIHEVTIGPFQIAVCPVTVREYAAFMSATGHAEPREWGAPPFADLDLPVCGVSWLDAVAYARWLGAITGRCYHLPTEAQREYASRGGLAQRAYPWGNDAPPLDGVYERGLAGDLVGGPMPVMSPNSTGPNGFGLWHMADNVHEWCADYYDRSYYQRSPAHDPHGPTTGDRRAARGGSWRHDIKFCRCAARSSLAPEKRFTDFGFRLACSDSFEYVD
jgi:formylglycine-generating enzyme required for sulfatase activity